MRAKGFTRAESARGRPLLLQSSGSVSDRSIRLAAGGQILQSFELLGSLCVPKGSLGPSRRAGGAFAAVRELGPRAKHSPGCGRANPSIDRRTAFRTAPLLPQ